MRGRVRPVATHVLRLFREDSICLSSLDGENYGIVRDIYHSTYVTRIGRGKESGSLQVPKKSVWSMSIVDV